MPNFTLEYKGFESQKEDIGLDIIFFECTVHPDDENEVSFPVSIPLSIVEEQIEETIPSGSSILKKIKKGIPGWGPQESQIAREIEECGIDLPAIVIQTIEARIDLEQEAKRWNILRSESPEQTEQILDDMEDSVNEAKTENENYFLLCSQLEKVITKEVVRLFPVIINSSSENIIKLKDILVDHIPGLAANLTDLISEANASEN